MLFSVLTYQPPELFSIENNFFFLKIFFPRSISLGPVSAPLAPSPYPPWCAWRHCFAIGHLTCHSHILHPIRTHSPGKAFPHHLLRFIHVQILRRFKCRAQLSVASLSLLVRERQSCESFCFLPLIPIYSKEKEKVLLMGYFEKNHCCRRLP